MEATDERPVWLLLLLTLVDSLRLDVSATVVMADASVRLACHVPRGPDNRFVTVGFRDWTSSTRQLDGTSARVTWEVFFTHVPCEPGPAFCSVTDSIGNVRRVVREIQVAGCAR